MFITIICKFGFQFSLNKLCPNKEFISISDVVNGFIITDPNERDNTNSTIPINPFIGTVFA